MTHGAPLSARRGDIGTLEVILTASCNLRCSYCYQNAKQARRMSWDTLAAALDVVLAAEKPEIQIVFLGGEPLLELPLIRRGIEYVEAALPADKMARFALSTNGLLLDDDAISFFFEHDVAVQVSFDGVPAAQEQRGPGTFAVLDALLDRLLRDHRPFVRRQLNIAITLHSGNVSHLADSVCYFIDKGVARVAAAPLHTHDAGWTRAHLTELERQMDRIFERSLQVFRETGEVPFEDFRRTAGTSRHGPAGRSMCGVGRGEAIAVDVDGQVTGCVTFANSYQRWPSSPLAGRLSAMRMGDLQSPEFPRRLALYPEAARAAEIFDAKHEKASSYARCGECRFLSECSVCPTSIVHIPGNSDPHRVPDNACAYNLVLLALRERFPLSPTPAARLLRATRAKRRAPRPLTVARQREK